MSSWVIHYKSAADRLSVKKGYLVQVPTLLIWEMLTGNPKKNLSTRAAETTTVMHDLEDSLEKIWKDHDICIQKPYLD